MADGDIKIVLSFDDRNYTVRIKDAAKELSAFQARADKTGESVKRMEQHMTSLGTSFRHAVQFFGMARFAVLDFYNVFLQLPQHILKTSGELERMTKLMEGLSKATDDATRKAEALSNTKFIIQTSLSAPFDVKALSDSFVKMKAGGLDPLDGSFKALIDSVARFGGTSETLHRASIAIQQMAGKGVISMEELRQQLGEAVPDAMKLMAESMGMTVGKLVDHISKGQVQSDAALKRLALAMTIHNAGQASAMMDTWVGALSQLKTYFTLFEAEVANSGFSTSMKLAIQEINAALNSPEGREGARELGRALGMIVDGLVTSVKALYEYRDAIKMAGGAILAVWGAEKISSLIVNATRAEMGFTALSIANAKARQTAAAAEAATKITTTATLTALTAELTAAQALQASLERSHRAGANIKIMQQATLIQQTQVLIAEEMALIAVRNKAMTQIPPMTRLLGFISGPIFLITTALTLGAVAWEIWGNKAKSAIEKAKLNADAGTGTKDDLATLNQLKGTSQANLEDAEKALAKMGDKEYDARSPLGKKKARLLEDVKKYSQEIRNVNQDIRNVEAAVAKTESEARIAVLNKVNESEVKKIATQFQEKREAINKAEKEELLKTTNPAEILKIQQKAIDARTAIGKEDLAAQYVYQSAQVKLAEDAVRAAETNGSKDVAVLRDVLARREELFKTTAAQYKDSNLYGTAVLTAGKGDKKGRKDTEPQDPLADAIASQKGDLNKAQITLGNLGKDVITFQDRRDAIAADMLGELASGKWDRTDKKGVKSRPGIDETQVQESIDLRAKIEQSNNARKAELVLLKDKKDIESELQESAERLASDLPAQASNLKSLASAYAALGATLTLEEKALIGQGFELEVQDRMVMLATANINTYTRALMEKNRELEIGIFIGTESETREFAYANAVRKSREEIDAKVRDLREQGLTEEQISARTLQLRETQNKNLLLMQQQHSLNMRTPMEKMAQDWKDSAKAMGEATAKWANDGVEAIINFTKTGKFEFKSFVESILTDMLRIQLRKSLADPLAGLLGSIGKAAVGALIGSPGGTTAGVSTDFSLAAGQTSGLGLKFANGGVMTSAGKMPLNMYSKGGIANSPQMAMFGEGRMNEAYVPLPDGRSIPVSMKGNSGSNVQINVINQSGTPVNAQQQGGARFDGEKMILDVVLSAMNRPGAFRDGVKGAM